MKHLSNEQIQAVADNSAHRVERSHVESCAACTERVVERRDAATSFARLTDSIGLPQTTARRVEAALDRLPASEGATRLRPAAPAARWRPAALGTAVLAAAMVLMMVFVAPALKNDRGAVSAAEVLAGSAQLLAQPTTGIELLEYELVLDGVPKEMMPDHANGTYHVRQAIDHTTPGRFKFSTEGPGGQPISSIAQDPGSGRRVMMFNLEGQAYRFDVTVPSQVGPSLPEMERLHMEATIAMMQASGNPLMTVVESPHGRQYRIEVPKVTSPATNPVWDLTEARVLIDADDYRVAALEVKGTFLKQPYSVSYRLISRRVSNDVPSGTFEAPSQPGEIVITGEGSVVPARDAIVLALRELGRLRNAAPAAR